MKEVSARPHLLQGEQIATLVVHARQAIADELLGNVCQPVAIALQPLVRGKARALADFIEGSPRPVGNAAVEVAVGIAIEGSARRIGRALIDVRHLQSLAVVIGRVTAAMVDHNRVVLRNLIKVVNIKLAIVFHFCVVEEKSFDPSARRCIFGFRAEFVDDTGDRHKFDHIGIADQDVVEQYVAGSMIVTIDETGHDCHLLGVEGLRPFADERLHVFGAPDRGEPAGFDRERLCLGRAGIDRVNLGVEDDQIGARRLSSRCGILPV